MEIRFKQILVPTDFSDPSRYAMRFALSLAGQYNSEIHLLHVIQDVLPVIAQAEAPMAPTIYAPDMEQAIQGHLEDEVPTDLASDLHFELAIRRGTPFLEIVRYARHGEADLIVMATHGRTGLAHMLIGSVAEKVVRKAPCPVLTIRHPEQKFEMP